MDRMRQKLEDLTKRSMAFDAESDTLQQQYYDRKKLNFVKRAWLLFRILKRNTLIKYFERIFLYGPGLHERPWFKHIVFASGRYTGYAGQTWPGIREAIEDGDLRRVVLNLHIAQNALRRASHALEKSF